MRLNKRLSTIEGQSQYYFEKVELRESLYGNDIKPVNIYDRGYPFDFISRISHNASIGVLEIAMSLNSLTSSMESNDKVNGDEEDFFDLLGFPDEIIEQFFSFLTLKERMRMRLNNRLNKIESKSKFYLENMKLDRVRQPVKIQNRRYPFDFISRIAHNTSIGRLSIDFPDSIGLVHKFCNIMKTFRCIKELSLCYPNENWAKEIMTASFILDLSRRCEFLYFEICPINYMSPEILHNLYRSMSDDSARLRRISLKYINRKAIDGFLNLLGIAYANGRIICNRNIEVFLIFSLVLFFTLQAYMNTYNDVGIENYIHIFDGFSHISFLVREGEEDYYYDWDEDEYFNGYGPPITIKLLKNQKALNNAKNPSHRKGFTRVRMEVYPE
ncbi:hypothetical protein PRIPAC_82233 [Pristionchus pacificus]|nr:hypothetical protein PRIPAC_82233 [Pristionchus pacificus]